MHELPCACVAAGGMWESRCYRTASTKQHFVACFNKAGMQFMPGTFCHACTGCSLLRQQSETHLPRLWRRCDGCCCCGTQALQHRHSCQPRRTAHGERPESCRCCLPAVPVAQRMQQKPQRTLQRRVDCVVKPSSIRPHQPGCCSADVWVVEDRSHPAVGAAHRLKQPQQQLLLLLRAVSLAVAAVSWCRASVPADAAGHRAQAEQRSLHLLPAAGCSNDLLDAAEVLRPCHEVHCLQQLCQALITEPVAQRWDTEHTQGANINTKHTSTAVLTCSTQQENRT